MSAEQRPVALVTAAGRGMGAACARELASRGYRLALMSTSGAAAELAQELGGEGLTGSVTDPDALEALVRLAVDRWGRIDGVVINTGHPPKGDLLDLTDQDWQSGFELVLLDAIRLTRLVTPIMEAQGKGALVNISTFSAFEPSLDFPISSALRAGLGSFTKLFATRYAAAGLRMNTILPGFIDSYPESEEIVARIPMGRYGEVQEIAKTAAFLLSDDAGYITGQNLRVDGGITHSV